MDMPPYPDTDLSDSEDRVESAWDVLNSMYTDIDDTAAVVEELERMDVQSMDAESQLIYAVFLMKEDRRDDARIVIESLLQEYPNLAGAWLQLALLERGDGNKDAQEKALNAAIEADPSMAEAFSLRGDLAAEDSHWDLAKESYRQALKLDSQYVGALVGLAWVHAKDSQLEEALKLLNTALEIEPDYAYTWVDRSRVNLALDRYVDAEKDMSRAIELDSDTPWHYLDRARLRLVYFKNYDGALSDLNIVEELSPDNFLAMVYLAGLYDELRNFALAETYYQKVVSIRPDYFWAYKAMGKLTWMRGNYKEAAQWFKQATSEDDDFSLSLMVALSFLRAEDIPAYQKEIDQVLKRFKPGETAYEVIRFCKERNSDFFPINKLNKEPDKKLRDQLWFYMGVMYEIEGSKEGANVVYERIASQQGKMEFDMAWVAINGMGD